MKDSDVCHRFRRVFDKYLRLALIGDDLVIDEADDRILFKISKALESVSTLDSRDGRGFQCPNSLILRECIYVTPRGIESLLRAISSLSLEEESTTRLNRLRNIEIIGGVDLSWKLEDVFFKYVPVLRRLILKTHCHFLQ